MHDFSSSHKNVYNNLQVLREHVRMVNQQYFLWNDFFFFFGQKVVTHIPLKWEGKQYTPFLIWETTGYSWLWRNNRKGFIFFPWKMISKCAFNRRWLKSCPWLAVVIVPAFLSPESSSPPSLPPRPLLRRHCLLMSHWEVKDFDFNDEENEQRPKNRNQGCQVDLLH